MRSVTVALLAYQEAENLRVLLPRIHSAMRQTGAEYEILVVDTQKPLDETPDVCAELNARYVNQPGKGFADAFRCAIANARKELFLILDSDGSHNPDYIPEIYRKHEEEGYDIVIGSRYVEGGKTFDKKSSILMSHLLNGVFRVALGLKAKDISTDYRLYNTADLKGIELKNENYDVLQEVLLKIRLNRPGLRIGEVPITFEKRMFGESKRRLIPFIIDYIKSLFRLTAMRVKSERVLTSGGFFRFLFIAVMIVTLLLWTGGILKDGKESNQLDLFYRNLSDYLADWSNVVGYSSQMDPYHNLAYRDLSEKAYPPLTYVLLSLYGNLTDMERYYDANYFLNMSQDPLPALAHWLVTAVTLILIYEVLRHFFHTKRSTGILLSLLFILSRPMLFSIERGNTIILTFLLVLIYCLGYDGRQKAQREFALIALALAASFKMTPAVLGLLLLTDCRDWKAAVRTVVYGVIAFFVPFLFIKGRITDNVVQMFKNISLNLENYSGPEGCTLSACLFGLGISFRDLTITLLKVDLVILFLAGMTVCTKKWTRVMCASLLLTVIPGHSGTYCMLYMLPSFVLFLNEERHSVADFLVLAGALLCIQPLRGLAVSRLLNEYLGLLLLCATMGSYALVGMIRRQRSLCSASTVSCRLDT